MGLSQPAQGPNPTQHPAKPRAGIQVLVAKLSGQPLSCEMISVALAPSPTQPGRELGGYVGLVDHALAQGEVSVRQVGEGLQQDLGGDCGLKEGWVELVPEKRNKRHSHRWHLQVPEPRQVWGRLHTA